LSIKQYRISIFCIPFVFLLIYFQVFFADYAYLDEIHQLWHNNDNSNFIMFHTQGRWLSGLLFQKFFSSIFRIEQLKLLRLFSLLGWIITTFVWAVLFKKWIKWLSLPNEIWWLGSLYVACSISVCIYIGWASCFEVFLAVFAGLVSGHILFRSLHNQQKEIHLSNIIVLSSLLLGIISLFIYQNAFGIFLIPFFLHYVQRKKIKPDRVMIIGIIFYLAIYLLYYLLFKYSLRAYHIEASTRTEIHFNFFKKLSFFFSGPFPQGFSINLLFRPGSIFLQIFYLLVFTVWLIITFKRNKHNTIAGNVLFVTVIVFLLVLIYLPSVIAAESFASYRTLFVFNLAVFILVTDSLLYLFRQEKKRRLFTLSIGLWLMLTGIYAFNFQYINPLKKEYKILKSFVQANYNTGINQVYFIRADKFLFTPEFHTRVYRDEFGTPSTCRDWVPEPIIKQMVFQSTKNRNIADSLTVIQFENHDLFIKAGVIPNANTLVVDMNLLFK
jgi:hypothetical protein